MTTKSPRLKKVLGVTELPEITEFSHICAYVNSRVMVMYGLHRPKDINYGYCFIWAYLVSKLSKERVKFLSSENHVMVYHPKMKKYYDSEHIDGVTNPHKVYGMDNKTWPTFMLDRNEMVFYWSHAGICARRLVELVLKLDPRHVLKKLSGNRYYDEIDSQFVTITESVVDLKRLAKGVQNIEAQKTS